VKVFDNKVLRRMQQGDKGN